MWTDTFYDATTWLHFMWRLQKKEIKRGPNELDFTEKRIKKNIAEKNPQKT